MTKTNAQIKINDIEVVVLIDTSQVNGISKFWFNKEQLSRIEIILVFNI